jgi:hypothetical protein
MAVTLWQTMSMGGTWCRIDGRAEVMFIAKTVWIRQRGREAEPIKSRYT